MQDWCPGYIKDPLQISSEKYQSTYLKISKYLEEYFTQEEILM